jgi:hypothetical protein
MNKRKMDRIEAEQIINDIIEGAILNALDRGDEGLALQIETAAAMLADDLEVSAKWRDSKGA